MRRRRIVRKGRRRRRKRRRKGMTGRTKTFSLSLLVIFKSNLLKAVVNVPM
jgi:hypothetical protein